MTTPVLRLDGITKRFGPLVANDSISLELGGGEVLALLGENGAGKTTLMNILFGHYVADAGRIEAFGQHLPEGSPAAAIAAGIGMVHQHFTLADNLTVLDNVMLGTESLWAPRQRRAEARARLTALERDFGLAVDPDATVGSLAVGQQQRVEILKALYRDAKILILDEPTAVLTPQETDRLFDTLRRMVARGLSVIFISHKLNEVMAIADRIAVLRQGAVVAGFDKEATSREELAAAMVGRTLAEPKRTPLDPGRPVLEIQAAGVSGRHGGQRLESVDLTAREHEIVGIAGVSGNGQSALADLIGGLVVPDTGSLRMLGEPVRHAGPAAMVERGVGRVPEDRHATGVVGDMTVRENLILEDYGRRPFSRFGLLGFSAIAAWTDRLIASFDIRCSSSAVPVRSLSGGNMQKLILARVLAREPKLILANQPTRGLDVGAIAYVHEKLFEARARGAGIVLISEDLEELLALSDRIAVIYQGRLSEPEPVENVTLTGLGLSMSGHGAFERGTDQSHAA